MQQSCSSICIGIPWHVFINLVISTSSELLLTVTNYISLISVVDQRWRFQPSVIKISINYYFGDNNEVI